MTDCSLEDQCMKCVLGKAHNNTLSEEEAAYFGKNRIEVNYRRGETIFKQGTKAFSIVCIKSGLVKMYREDGLSYSTLFLKKEGDLIGLQSLYTQGIYHFSAEALSDIEACFIDISAFEKLFSKNTEFATEMIQYINQDMLTVFEKLYSYSTKHIHGRLAEFLLYLHQHIYGSNPFHLTLSKTDLSEILGTSKESISRLFKEFKHDRIINETNHRIEILDFPRLKRISTTG